MCLLCSEMVKMQIKDVVRAWSEVPKEHRAEVLDKIQEEGLTSDFLIELEGMNND